MTSSSLPRSLRARDLYGWAEQQCAALRDHDSARLEARGDWSDLGL